MKKMTMICMAALLVMAMSCKKEKVENTAGGAGFRATLEAHAGDSKTHLEEGTKVKWDADDVVTVVNADNDAKTFVISAIHDDYSDLVPAEGQEVTEAFYKPNYKAYYPAAIYDAGQVSLPQTQDYADGSFGKGFNPMAAYAVNKNLDFKNLCGILKFQLYSASSCTVKSLRVTSLKTGEQLWGTGTVTFDGTNATLGALTGGTGSITLDCGDGVDLSTSEGTPTEFMFVIPGGALSEGFTVTVTDADNKVWSKTTTASNTITKSKIKAMPKQAVTTTKPVEFTVDADGTTVKFSPGNLQYLGSSDGTGTWRFADHQWDIMGAGPSAASNKGNVDLSSLGYSAGMYNTGSGTAGPNETDADKAAARDLFGWGCTGYQDTRTSSTGYQKNYRPYSTSKTAVSSSDPAYYINRYGYGPDYMSPYFNLTVENYSDWGYVTGLPSAGGGKSWRTLSKNEWGYLLNTSNASSGARTDVNRFAKAMVNDVKGLLIFPDGYELPEGYTTADGGTGMAKVNKKSSSDAPWPSQNIPDATWTSMESAGVVFLPAAGFRFGTSVSDVGSRGYYWLSWFYNMSNAYIHYFDSGDVVPAINGYSRCYGFSVRLVSEN